MIDNGIKYGCEKGVIYIDIGSGVLGMLIGL